MEPPNRISFYPLASLWILYIQVPRFPFTGIMGQTPLWGKSAGAIRASPVLACALPLPRPPQQKEACMTIQSGLCAGCVLRRGWQCSWPMTWLFSWCLVPLPCTGRAAGLTFRPSGKRKRIKGWTLPFSRCADTSPWSRNRNADCRGPAQPSSPVPCYEAGGQQYSVFRTLKSRHLARLHLSSSSLK